LYLERARLFPKSGSSRNQEGIGFTDLPSRRGGGGEGPRGLRCKFKPLDVDSEAEVDAGVSLGGDGEPNKEDREEMLEGDGDLEFDPEYSPKL